MVEIQHDLHESAKMVATAARRISNEVDGFPPSELSVVTDAHPGHFA